MIRRKLKHNYHTHTVYCRHAKNTVEEMIKEAIECGYETLGFSEHAPLKIHRNFRLNIDNVQDYIDEVNSFKKKYEKDIKIFCGFETEYHKSQYEFYKNLRTLPGVDYMILGNHNAGNPHQCNDWNSTKSDLFRYCDQLEDACRSGLYSCVAHPDYIFRYYGKWDENCEIAAKRIIDVSMETKTPLGFNLNGLIAKSGDLDYPCERFWKIVSKSSCSFLLEVDAHTNWILRKPCVDQGFEFIKKYKLENNLISALQLK